MKKIVLLFFAFSTTLFAQHNNPNPGYWQQNADYKMDVEVDVKNFTYKGKQKLVYTNHSPDTLYRVFYHLFFNAFQPGSAMDARLQSIPDPDGRMMHLHTNADGSKSKVSKIADLGPKEIGYLKVFNLKQDGQTVESKTVGTILEVNLAKPLAPNSSTTFTLDFEGQVPEMVRRAGRNSEEGVALSMAQWYPKMAEFDFEGWHADPYIGREFHGVWGNFDVKITLDKNYIVGGTGYLQNGDQIGYNYQKEGVEVKIPKEQKKLTWHFVAPNVHDFTWAADPDYIHDKRMTEDGVMLHFLYKNNPKYNENWKKLELETEKLMLFYNKAIGKYPYKQYSVIQGGDGGMEYAMCTLITGNRSFESLVGVTAHELAHSWFQHLLATNESKHEWMDEGFTSFISDYAIFNMSRKEGDTYKNPFQGAYDQYNYMVKSTKEEPLSTHADRYSTNTNYGISAYSKGTIFLTQLAYLIGWDNLFLSLQKYYKDYQFSHPTPNDFKRTVERVTGADLDWYLTDWTQTTNFIDYGIKEVSKVGNQSLITLERIGNMPMPIEVYVIYQDGTISAHYIPLTIMRWTKPNTNKQMEYTVEKPWDWANPTYQLAIDTHGKTVEKVMIDPSDFMADVNKGNNTK